MSSLCTARHTAPCRFIPQCHRGGPWVEFWSGALQIWDYCEGVHKVIPIGSFRGFCVWPVSCKHLR
eukprot:35508-Eustigmatos_ZCMA.PRE.1